ncbi:hypothetical protein LX36DRAFT_344667 [Colletotrichum falcatum]|nr:hypothetical protein LX36DRAFT_344667 [Colletotrichum falcatum]
MLELLQAENGVTGGPRNTHTMHAAVRDELLDGFAMTRYARLDTQVPGFHRARPSTNPCVHPSSHLANCTAPGYRHAAQSQSNHIAVATYPACPVQAGGYPPRYITVAWPLSWLFLGFSWKFSQRLRLSTLSVLSVSWRFCYVSISFHPTDTDAVLPQNTLSSAPRPLGPQPRRRYRQVLMPTGDNSRSEL